MSDADVSFIEQAGMNVVRCLSTNDEWLTARDAFERHLDTVRFDDLMARLDAFELSRRTKETRLLQKVTMLTRGKR